MSDEPRFLEVGQGAESRAIAVRARAGGTPGLFWVGGLKSDMNGTKAMALDRWAAEHGRALVRFDYSGHGESGGRFDDGTIGRWLEEALAVFETRRAGPQVVIGSSMGGWIALLMLRELKRRGREVPLAGLVLIAPAVDFTEELMWKRFTPAIRRQLVTEGSWERPSQYSEQPYRISLRFLEEGRRHLMFGGLIETGCPVRILQGVEDPDVPWRHAVELVSRLAQDDVVLTLVKDGDHRLSRPEDIERLLAVIAEF